MEEVKKFVEYVEQRMENLAKANEEIPQFDDPKAQFAKEAMIGAMRYTKAKIKELFDDYSNNRPVKRFAINVDTLK